MSDRRFTLDTNVLLHALDRRAGQRHVIAQDIINRAVLVDCWLTLQSISEFYYAATRKRVVAVDEARDQAMDWLSMFQTATASVSAVASALTVAASARASYWDALLVATAAEAGCSAILTEDLAHNTTLLGVSVINPFGERELCPEAAALLTVN
jgi:predicted nucleic acid-binding protein